MNFPTLKTSFFALSALAGGVVLTSPAHAGDSAKAVVPSSPVMTPAAVDSGFTFEGFGGLLFLGDLEGGDGSRRVDAGFDTGWLAGGAVGYALTPALSIEIEGAHGQADVDRLAFGGRGLGDFYGDVTLTQVAANLIYEFGPDNAITPYVGFGLGAGFLDADFGGAGNRFDDSDTALYYQFIGGVSVDLNPGARLFAEYRFGTMDEFELSSGGGAGVSFDELNAHQALVGIEITF